MTQITTSQIESNIFQQNIYLKRQVANLKEIAKKRKKFLATYMGNHRTMRSVWKKKNLALKEEINRLNREIERLKDNIEVKNERFRMFKTNG